MILPMTGPIRWRDLYDNDLFPGTEFDVDFTDDGLRITAAVGDCCAWVDVPINGQRFTSMAAHRQVERDSRVAYARKYLGGLI